MISSYKCEDFVHNEPSNPLFENEQITSVKIAQEALYLYIHNQALTIHNFLLHLARIG